MNQVITRKQIATGMLTLIAMVGLIVAAFRYTRRVSEQLNGTTGPVTLRFFRDPKPLQVFTMYDLDHRVVFKNWIHAATR